MSPYQQLHASKDRLEENLPGDNEDRQEWCRVVSRWMILLDCLSSPRLE